MPSGWGVSPWGAGPFGAGANVSVVAGLQVGPRAFEVRFDKAVEGEDGTLRNVANWSLVRIAGSGPATLTPFRIDYPVGALHPNRVYVLVNEQPLLGATYTITVTGITAQDGGALGTNTVNVVTAVLITPYTPREQRIEDYFDTLRSIRSINVDEDPIWKAKVQAAGGIDALILGSRTVVLQTSVTDAGAVTATLDTGPFDLTEVPSGPYDGTNKTWRTQQTFDWRYVEAIVAPLGEVNFSDAPAYRDDWYAPGGGAERLFRMFDAPSRGSPVVLRYTPRRGLIRIGDEIISYTATSSQLDAKEITFLARAQIGTEAQAHDADSLVYDVWGGSILEMMISGRKFRTGTDSLLGLRAKDIGVDRLPEFLDDRSLRRVLLHVGVGKKNTIDKVRTAIRYLYRNIWEHVIVAEDPRWPRAVSLWYSPTLSLQAAPEAYEPWEDWLEEGVPQDGADPLEGSTFLLEDSDDFGYIGSFFTSDASDAGTDPSYAVYVSGDDIFDIGTPSLPPPPAPDTTYLGMRIKPRELERVLPAGVGLLLLQYPS